ncbi:hypothetical protein MUY27_02940 [Mucilaginibacter sp. RS28]|uniref:Response regulatory domain-containing protein n=1 Tax=Mucilaginibacter straminoryzae TaxID=2932774 RepID=A0A9X2B7K4_9SPHI|nr:hypothetical protein [Mucilaginibacter straminoryzae]MCJ8208649.1 hypothetical protein [Mucilaginibacter straminoryzae]
MDTNRKMLLLDRDNNTLDVAHDIMFYGYTDMHITAEVECFFQLAKNYKPDLIIIDQLFADIYIEELCNQLRSDDQMKGIPVITVSKTYHRIISNETKSADTLYIRQYDSKAFADKVNYLMAS